MERPDPRAGARELAAAGFIDPVVAAQVTLVEAQYLKTHAAAIAAWAPTPSRTRWDLSPLGR